MWQVGATLHRGAQASHYRGLSLRSTGSRRAGSVIVAHGPTCSVACGIFPDQGSNPCPLHWQADSQPLRHQGSPLKIFNQQIPLLFSSSFNFFFFATFFLLLLKKPDYLSCRDLHILDFSDCISVASYSPNIFHNPANW